MTMDFVCEFVIIVCLSRDEIVVVCVILRYYRWVFFFNIYLFIGSHCVVINNKK